MIGVTLVCRDRVLELKKPVVMGVLNVTPDSFSDGGLFVSIEAALTHADKMITQGAQIIDVGGESTRPGAAEVPVEVEIERVVPVVHAVHNRFPDIIISVDTGKPAVMQAAIEAGARLINDVNALRSPGAGEIVAQSGAAVSLMHMQGAPRTMQTNPSYVDVVNEVKQFLQQRVEYCLDLGISREHIMIDPGFGFGKSVAHNLSLVRHLPEFVHLGLPVLVGMSRKSTIGAIVDRQSQDRLAGSLAFASVASWLGAHVIRAHDVAETVDALKICNAIKTAS